MSERSDLTDAPPLTTVRGDAHASSSESSEPLRSIREANLVAPLAPILFAADRGSIDTFTVHSSTPGGLWPALHAPAEAWGRWGGLRCAA